MIPTWNVSLGHSLCNLSNPQPSEQDSYYAYESGRVIYATGATQSVLNSVIHGGKEQVNKILAEPENPNAIFVALACLVKQYI